MNTFPMIEEFLSCLTDERHFSTYELRCYGAINEDRDVVRITSRDWPREHRS